MTFDTKTGVAVVLQQDDYYPFGYEISRGTITSPKNEYLYNKKELQEELQQYDYGARFYDPVIGRWTVVDNYAEHPDQIYLSPYVYVGNNPIDKTDPDGNCPPCDIIYPTDPGFRLMHPDLAKIHDVAYNILDAVGIVNLVNSIGHTGDKNVSAKDKVGHVVQAAAGVFTIGEDGEGEGVHLDGLKIEIEPFNKMDRELLNPPKEHGNAPTFKKDGKPVDIHHEGQKAEGPFHERHPDNHRTSGSYRENHSKGQKPLTKGERQQFNKAKREYWKKEYPK